MLKRGPARYRSKATGQYVSFDFANEHPDEAYRVNRTASPALVSAAVGGLLAASVAGGLLYRSRSR
jgi:hypothetical protein